MKHRYPLAMLVITGALAASLLRPAAADVRRYHAYVYPDRTAPDMTLSVDDFRVNETIWDEGGVQYIRVRGAAGTFKLPFSAIRQVEVVKYLGLVQGDVSHYEVKVTGTGGETYLGKLELRLMRGVVNEVPWHLFPATASDRGAKFWRLVLGADTAEPTLPAALPEAAAPPPPPAAEVALPPPEPPARRTLPAPSEDELFERMSLEELNRQQPLKDVFFDFDRSEILPDSAATMQQNAAWMKRWPTTKIRVEGHADPRGTHEYNLGLGERRALSVQRELAALGVSPDRVEVVTRNASVLVCEEANEACWSRNRRATFTITAK